MQMTIRDLADIINKLIADGHSTTKLTFTGRPITNIDINGDNGAVALELSSWLGRVTSQERPT